MIVCLLTAIIMMMLVHKHMIAEKLLERVLSTSYACELCNLCNPIVKRLLHVK